MLPLLLGGRLNIPHDAILSDKDLGWGKWKTYNQAPRYPFLLLSIVPCAVIDVHSSRAGMLDAGMVS